MSHSLKLVRNCGCGLFSLLLIAAGVVRRAKNRSLTPGCITAIYFHSPNRRLFARCIRWLASNGYVFIDARQLRDILYGGTPAPRGAVWLSLDDGWREIVTEVLPVIQDVKVPITIFLPSGPVEGNGVFWWTYVRQFWSRLPAGLQRDGRSLWTTPESERRRITDVLESMFGTEMSRQALTVSELREVSRFPEVTIGSHTVHHAITTNCNRPELEEELKGSRQSLEAWTGKPVTLFSYPCGRYSERDKPVVQELGYEVAATTDNALITRDTDPLCVPRFSVADDIWFAEAVCNMVGVWRPWVARIKSRAESFHRWRIVRGEA